MSLHQLSNRSCTVAMRSQSPFVLKNILSVIGLFSARTDDSLSHRNRTDLILIRPDLKSVPSADIPAMMPSSYERYDDMRSAGPSSVPLPLSRICSSLIAIIQPW
jgi:hypothetical protein